MLRFQKLICAVQQCGNQFLRGAYPIRTLYSQNVLGIDGYIGSRQRTASYAVTNAEKFKSKMEEFVQPESNNVIFTEDLKNMVHIVEATPADLELVVKMCKKFHSQTKEVRFGNYIFGPVVMRMFHYLDSAELALKCFNDPELEGFFNHTMCYQILLDMLYRKELYDDILEAYNVIRTRQPADNQFPRHIVVLVFAACYKQNSPQSLEYMKKLWKDHNDAGHHPMRKAATFAAGLALNQNEPHVSLEILSTIKQMNYMTVRNLRVLALARMNRLEDALPIVRTVLENNDQVAKSQTFAKNVIDEFRDVINKSDNQEVISQFKRIDKYLIDNGHITNEQLDTLLSAEITQTTQTAQRKERSILAASYAERFRVKNRNNIDYNQRPSNTARPGLRELY